MKLDEILSWMKKRSTTSANAAKEAEKELATLRAQLAEARDIVIVLAYTNEMLSPEESREFVSVDMRVSVIRSARAWYNKVTTA